VIGIWVALLDTVLVLMLLVKGIPHRYVWKSGHFVAARMPWTSQDTAILALLLVLQPFIFVLLKLWRERGSRTKSRKIALAPNHGERTTP
jgi:hypothetical protein